MGRRKQQPTTAADAEQEAALPKGAVVDSSSHTVFVPLGSDSSEPEYVQSTDSVAEVLAGNYSESIVDEVRKYAKPEWDVEPSSLDPIDDIQTFYDYDFRLPPDDYDAYQAAAKLKLDELEAMKDKPDGDTAAKIAARKELVKDMSADDIRWLKHKAYYRGIQRIRAGKIADAAEAEAEAAAEAAASGKAPHQQQQQQAPLLPQQQQQRKGKQSQQQQRYAHYSDDEVLAGVGEPSEWEMSWTAADYTQHPQVLQQLRSTFSAGLGLPPYKTPQQQAAEAEATWREVTAAAVAAQQQEEEEGVAKQELLRKYQPYQAYTQQYLEEQRRQKVLSAHRRHKQQALWLSLGLALGSSAYRWWKQQGSSGKRRRGAATPGRQQQGGGSSRRSTRPPTPSGLQMQGAIAE